MTLKHRRGLLIALPLVLILMCAVAVAVGTFWAVGPSQSCRYPAQGPAEAGWSARTVASGGGERCYHLYVPPGYDPSQPAPVVVSLHGWLSNPNSHAEISLWHRLADQEGFLVVYPQGTSFPQRWNSHSNWEVAGVDDVQFFRDTIDDLSVVAAMDRSRVYVNGFSNGGAMSVQIACQVADEVAAIGTVAGAVVAVQDCDLSRPVPAMAFHGTADPLAPYEGGNLQGRMRQAAELVGAPTTFAGAEDWVAAMAQQNGCNPVPEVIPPRGDARGVRYRACDKDAEITLFTIEGGGHTWPGGTPIPFMGKTSKDIDATEEMWRFFQAYSLEDPP
jgi:polyhydroxybutyrate depolymerase